MFPDKRELFREPSRAVFPKQGSGYSLGSFEHLGMLHKISKNLPQVTNYQKMFIYYTELHVILNKNPI